MGKRILVQRRGRGGFQFRAPELGKIAPTHYPHLPFDVTVKGVVTSLLHERGRSAPLAQIRFDRGLVTYVPAVTGLSTGNQVELGPTARPERGNILPLAAIPEGTQISNIEARLGDGGKVARSGGASAILFSHRGEEALVKLPSGKLVPFKANCRATIGVIAGGGRVEKPFLRAGARWHMMRSRGHKYPFVRGVAMAAVYHPHGGGRHQRPGGSTSVSRNAPPGRKVGHIAPRRTGRGRAKREGG